MAKPTFYPRKRDGSPIGQPIEFTPLMFIAGTETHRLALHRSVGSEVLAASARVWSVSDPVSGACIVSDVGSYYKGILCASRGLSLRDARNNAMAALDRLLERIGSDKFNQVLADAARQFSEA